MLASKEHSSNILILYIDRNVFYSLLSGKVSQTELESKRAQSSINNGFLNVCKRVSDRNEVHRRTYIVDDCLLAVEVRTEAGTRDA